jgi:hypothetical protein
MVETAIRTQDKAAHGHRPHPAPYPHVGDAAHRRQVPVVLRQAARRYIRPGARHSGIITPRASRAARRHVSVPKRRLPNSGIHSSPRRSQSMDDSASGRTVTRLPTGPPPTSTRCAATRAVNRRRPACGQQHGRAATFLPWPGRTAWFCLGHPSAELHSRGTQTHPAMVQTGCTTGQKPLLADQDRR